MGGFNSGASSNYGKYSAQDININQSQTYVVNTNNNFSSADGNKGYGTENIESVSFEIHQNSNGASVIDRVRAELDEKTVVEDRDTVEYEERVFSGHITKYDDGTVVLTDVNQFLDYLLHLLQFSNMDLNYSYYAAHFSSFFIQEPIF